VFYKRLQTNGGADVYISRRLKLLLGQAAFTGCGIFAQAWCEIVATRPSSFSPP
jgi:hypothetical protein